MGQDSLWDSKELDWEWTVQLICSSFFVFDKPASWTARSKTKNIHSIPFPRLLLAVPEAVSSHTKTRSRSAVQSIFCVATCCPRGSLVPYKSEETQFHQVLALWVPRLRIVAMLPNLQIWTERQSLKFYILFFMSCVPCHVLRVSCHYCKPPTARATGPLAANYLIMHSRLVHQTQKPNFFVYIKNQQKKCVEACQY